nr:MAG TPA: hypothetical protein [Caudoviricetes sp.]
MRILEQEDFRNEGLLRTIQGILNKTIPSMCKMSLIWRSF